MFVVPTRPTMKRQSEKVTTRMSRPTTNRTPKPWPPCGRPKRCTWIPETGEEAVGREEIEKEFAETFEGLKDAKLEIDVKAIKFLSPNVAVESGTARTIRPKEEPDVSTYSALFVKRDGKWLLDRVTEEETAGRSDSAAFELRTLERPGMDGRLVDR